MDEVEEKGGRGRSERKGTRGENSGNHALCMGKNLVLV